MFCYFVCLLFAGLWTVGNCSMVTIDPFDNGRELYIPSFWLDEIDISIGLHPTEELTYTSLKDYSVAFWFDTMSSIQNGSDMLATALCYQENSDINYTVVIVVYDLPNRDCAAAASHGEIDCEDAQCANGLSTYKTSYIDEIYSLLSQYPTLQFIAIIEPDSLPNIATNMHVAKCVEAKVSYVTGIGYAIEKLSFLDNIAIYVDAAHSGWLGWADNQEKFARVMNQVFSNATNSMKSTYTSARIDGIDVTIDSSFDASKLIRGYSSNVAGYQALGCLDSCDDIDPCGLESQFNFAFNEVLYANAMRTTMTTYTNMTDVYGWIVDTSRNGEYDSRDSCSNWCNIENAGLGERPTIDDTEIESITEYSDGIDALLWIKIPGESDGTSDSTADRFDDFCISDDSLSDAPEAGEWFDQFFVNLETNADPTVTQASSVIDNTISQCANVTGSWSGSGNTGGTDSSGTGSIDDSSDEEEANNDDGDSNSGIADWVVILLVVLAIVVLLFIIGMGLKKCQQNKGKSNATAPNGNGQTAGTGYLTPPNEQETQSNIVAA